MKYLRRCMCEQRLRRIMARRLNQADQKAAFGISYSHSVRVREDRLS